MMKRLLLVCLVSLAIGFEAIGEGPAEQAAQLTTTQRVGFAAGGVIRCINSYGDLTIEGWDLPQVEVTVTKSTRYDDPVLKERLVPRLDTVQVRIEPRLPAELTISTLGSGIQMEYLVHVPRDTRLFVKHRGGIVTVENVRNDIDVANRDGDIVLMLPARGNYSLEARTRMGHIASDFGGKTLSRLVVGQKFQSRPASASAQLHLRTGFGGITLLALSPEGEGLSSAGQETEEPR
jgi:hypothetical protein